MNDPDATVELAEVRAKRAMCRLVGSDHHVPTFCSGMKEKEMEKEWSEDLACLLRLASIPLFAPL